MKHTLFLAHLAVAEVCCAVPLWALHWSIGLLAAIIVLAAVELAHGMWDEILSALALTPETNHDRS